jgi:hypothetical protein
MGGLLCSRHYDGVHIHRKKHLNPNLCPTFRPRLWIAGAVKPVYIDLIKQVDYGHSLKKFIYAVYYGQRHYIFIELYYARLEIGWRLFNFSYNTSLKELLM